jgi:transcriptional regulator with XRE-family HTH domain
MSENHNSRDDLDVFLDEQLQDEQFKVAYEDAAARSRLLRRLTSRRNVRKTSQSAVARLMQTTQSAVSDLENGSTDPRLSTLQRYARAIGCRLEIWVKDYPAGWQADCFHEEVAINPVQIITDNSASDWQVPVNRTSIQVSSVSAIFAGKDASLA